MMTRYYVVGAFAFLIGGTIHAQPVLQNSNIASGSYDVAAIFGATNAFIDGQNITWDVSADSTEVIGIASLGMATGTPFSGQFPTCNWAMNMQFLGLDMYTYYRVDAAGLEVWGEFIGSGFDETYSNPFTQLEFPSNYNDTFMDAFQIQGGATEFATWTYTGYGTLITAVGTFQNVVKMHHFENDRAIFWNSVPLYPLMDIDFVGDGAILAPSTSQIAENERMPTIALHPNPATSVITITGIEDSDRIAVLDVVGREVMVQRSTNNVIDVSGMENGTYLLRVVRDMEAFTVPFMKN